MPHWTDCLRTLTPWRLSSRCYATYEINAIVEGWAIFFTVFFFHQQCWVSKTNRSFFFYFSVRGICNRKCLLRHQGSGRRLAAEHGLLPERIDLTIAFEHALILNPVCVSSNYLSKLVPSLPNDGYFNPFAVGLPTIGFCWSGYLANTKSSLISLICKRVQSQSQNNTPADLPSTVTYWCLSYWASSWIVTQ